MCKVEWLYKAPNRLSVLQIFPSGQGTLQFYIEGTFPFENEAAPCKTCAQIVCKNVFGAFFYKFRKGLLKKTPARYLYKKFRESLVWILSRYKKTQFMF